jgi:chromosome segregation ATPase
MLGNLRKQHEAKIIEWKGLVEPQEEQLRHLKSLPGLRSEQIKQCAEIETFLAEHNKAISSSEQAIKDINETLSLLDAEEKTCKKSLGEWKAFMAKEREEIQGLGSTQKYVVEKLAQLQGDTHRSKFEIISYARRLNVLDPANEPCKKFINSALGSK